MLDISLIILQVLIGFNLILPLLLYIVYIFKKEKISNSLVSEVYDYGIIVTAYEQTALLPSVVDSILKLNYSNFVIYVVADNCDVSNLKFNSDKVILLRPEQVLASNTRSHFYAIEHFIRPHQILTIIDSDNLVHPDYLNELNVFFASGYLAVQGVRTAKNLNTSYACLDEAGDIYYRFIDRKLMYDVGASASLSGSGMAFTTAFYQECLGDLKIEGAGFDKVLQIEILKRSEKIAFAEKAIVYDEKTSKPKQLVNQRSRWINTWFKYAGRGGMIALQGIKAGKFNMAICGIVFARPPMFLMAILVVLSLVIDILVLPYMLIFWALTLLAFFLVFFLSLSYYKAPKIIYKSLAKIPVFIFFQVISLFRAKNANAQSVSTEHFHDDKIDSIK